MAKLIPVMPVMAHITRVIHTHESVDCNVDGAGDIFIRAITDLPEKWAHKDSKVGE